MTPPYCDARGPSHLIDAVKRLRHVLSMHLITPFDGDVATLLATLAPHTATWRSGYAAACKAVYTGSIPVVASGKRP